MTSITRSLIRRAGEPESIAIAVPNHFPAHFTDFLYRSENMPFVYVSTYPDALRVWRTYSGHQRARVQALAWWRAVALRAERLGILP